VRVAFGDVVVDEGARQVTRGGVHVHVSPKAFDLLLALLRARPRVLSKEDLHARLWPDTFVSDASLAMLIAEVRAALGESAREPGVVRTVHRRGYAFQGEARELATAAADAAGAPPHGEAPAGGWLMTPTRHLPLPPGETIVGRDPSAGVWLDSPSVSRRHARIRVDGARVVVEDLGSKNGTHVGGCRVSAPVALSDGDTVRFGSIDVTFRTWTAPPTLTEGGA
jgi:DNA-binding winged helix-turn-helix (wHTH) protein